MTHIDYAPLFNAATPEQRGGYNTLHVLRMLEQERIVDPQGDLERKLEDEKFAGRVDFYTEGIILTDKVYTLNLAGSEYLRAERAAVAEECETLKAGDQVTSKPDLVVRKLILDGEVDGYPYGFFNQRDYGEFLDAKLSSYSRGRSRMARVADATADAALVTADFALDYFLYYGPADAAIDTMIYAASSVDIGAVAEATTDVASSVASVVAENSSSLLEGAGEVAGGILEGLGDALGSIFD
jgi:hypothetical protein